MGIYFSTDHSNNTIEENSDSNIFINQNEKDVSNNEINRNIRSKTAMLFKYVEEAKDDDSKTESATFQPLSFLEFVQKRPSSFPNTPIVVIEGVPISIQRMPLKSHNKNRQSNEDIIGNKNCNPVSLNQLKELNPNLSQKFSYKILNKELHQNFDISQFKVNAVRVWILKSNSVKEKTMAKAVECCRHFDFTSYVTNQYVRVENIFYDVKSNDFQSLASALRPQEFSNLSSSPRPNKPSNDLTKNLPKIDGLDGFLDFSKTAPISIPKYVSKSEKQKMLNIQIDTASNSSEELNDQPIRGFLSTSTSPYKNSHLSENSSENSSDNLSENLSENSPGYLSENSSELLLRNNAQFNNNGNTNSIDKPPISLLPLKLPTLTSERNCFSSRRPCEINCSERVPFETPQFGENDDFANYSRSSEDARIKFRYRNSNECDMVVPGLFIGGEKAAHDKKLLWNLKITHIVNLNFNENGNNRVDDMKQDLDDDDTPDEEAPAEETQTEETPLSSLILQPKNKRQMYNSSPRSKSALGPSPSKIISPSTGESNSPRNDTEISKVKENTDEGGIAKSNKIFRFNVRLSDSVFQDLNDDFWGALKFVEQAIKGGGNVLAHCRRGISRSAALCVAYLMDDRGMSFDDAIALLKRQRPSVNINQGFEDQLRAFAKTVEGKKKEEKDD